MYLHQANVLLSVKRKANEELADHATISDYGCDGVKLFTLATLPYRVWLPCLA